MSSSIGLFLSLNSSFLAHCTAASWIRVVHHARHLLQCPTAKGGIRSLLHPPRPLLWARYASCSVSHHACFYTTLRSSVWSAAWQITFKYLRMSNCLTKSNTMIVEPTQCPWEYFEFVNIKCTGYIKNLIVISPDIRDHCSVEFEHTHSMSNKHCHVTNHR